jgi:hypothetical protein
MNVNFMYIGLIICCFQFCIYEWVEYFSECFHFFAYNHTKPITMKYIKILLRAISSDGKNQLMLFDSNRNGAINDLVTIAQAGSTIIWKRDRCSGIKKVLKIHSKSGQASIFRSEPVRFWIFNIFTLKLSYTAKGEEAYSIEYLLRDNTKVTIDPTIKIPPP